MLILSKVVPVKPPKACGKPLNTTAGDFQDFIDTCIDHQSVGTKKYRDLNEAIKDKSGHQLKSERFCFPSDCRRTFNRDKILLSRKRKDNDGPSSLSIIPSRLSRSSINRFDYKKCLFCLEDKQVPLHDIMQESKENEFKLTFEQCPNSLQICMIRYLEAHDAMTGELKYHQTCWNTIIVQRVPEVKHTTIGNTLDLHSPNTSVVPSDIVSFDSPPSYCIIQCHV